MTRNKKGQAAMEFLMTYGWAILAAVIAIGVLAYFGVFNPSKWMPTACVLNNPFGCESYVVNTTGVHMMITNGQGEALIVNSVAVTGCTTNDNSGAGWTLPASGTPQSVYLTGCSTTAGSKFKGDITVSYRKASGGYDLSSTGSLTAQVQ
ncbi:MAG: hypothetical protein WC867_01555 [Candidatus Pacearchaeota archaeon]|jgi:hypothetical protein